MARQATVLLSEGIRLEFDGKFTVVGLFTSNIGIAASVVGSILHFLIIIEGDVDHPLTSLSIEILMPGAIIPSRFDFPTAQLLAPPPLAGQQRWKKILPVHLTNVALNPGPINCRLIHDQGMIEIAAGWIAISQPPTGPSTAILPPSGQSQPSGL
jgi:hypothetical protein